jgi:hypothetical protein
VRRFRIFYEDSMPVVERLMRLGKVRRISAVPPKEVIFAQVRRIIEGVAKVRSVITVIVNGDTNVPFYKEGLPPRLESRRLAVGTGVAKMHCLPRDMSGVRPFSFAMGDRLTMSFCVGSFHRSRPWTARLRWSSRMP